MPGLGGVFVIAKDVLNRDGAGIACRRCEHTLDNVSWIMRVPHTACEITAGLAVVVAQSDADTLLAGSRQKKLSLPCSRVSCPHFPSPGFGPGDRNTRQIQRRMSQRGRHDRTSRVSLGMIQSMSLSAADPTVFGLSLSQNNSTTVSQLLSALFMLVTPCFNSLRRHINSSLDNFINLLN